MNTRKGYPTDVTDKEWQRLDLLVPAPQPGGRPITYPRREIVNAIFYLLRTGCAWWSRTYRLLVTRLILTLLVSVGIHSTRVYADSVIPPNAIVPGAICIGPECVNGEDFTEIDWKIKFNDTPGLRFQQTNTGGNPAQNWDLGANELTFFIQDFTHNKFPFQISTSALDNSLNVGSNGTVGFGTANPIGNGPGIHIFGTATTDVFSGVGPNPNTGPAFNFGYSGSSFERSSGFFNIRPDASALAPNPSLRFATANVQRMIIDNLGNVGIGQFGATASPPNRGTSPQAKLHVQGTILAQGNITTTTGFFVNTTQLNVPDYVFEPHYNLLPLKQLAAYVEKEKHLPDVPSAQDIKVQGSINLGDMQLTLLKKVEELTLYTLQQEQTLTSLKKQNRRLKTENGELYKRLSAIEAAVRQLTNR